MPLVLDYRNIRLEQLFVWHPELAATITEGAPMPLGRYLRYEDSPYLAGTLDGIISEARRDRAEFGFAQLRLVLVFLRWHNLKEAPAERIHLPLLLLPAWLLLAMALALGIGAAADDAAPIGMVILREKETSSLMASRRTAVGLLLGAPLLAACSGVQQTLTSQFGQQPPPQGVATQVVGVVDGVPGLVPQDAQTGLIVTALDFEHLRRFELGEARVDEIEGHRDGRHAIRREPFVGHVVLRLDQASLVQFGVDLFDEAFERRTGPGLARPVRR